MASFVYKNPLSNVLSLLPTAATLLLHYCYLPADLHDYLLISTASLLVACSSHHLKMDKFMKKSSAAAAAATKSPAKTSPPSKKRKRAPQDLKFSAKWASGRSWLSCSETGMRCSTCEEFGAECTITNSFVVGTTSYKVDTVKKHETSVYHQKAATKKAAKMTPVAESTAAKLVTQLSVHHQVKMEKLFRIVHAVIRHNSAVSDYLWIFDLAVKLEVEVGITYRNRTAATTFLTSMAAAEFKSVASTCANSHFFCVIGDGSTDTSVKEQEMWFLRSARGGIIQTKFIGVHSPEKADAKSITEGLKSIVAENLDITWEDFIVKTVVLACDGASVMTGCRAGVGALLRADQPELLTLHCMAHRLELAFKDATKKNQLHDKAINVLLMGIYYFYKKSALNRSMLQRSHDALHGDSSRLLIPTRIGGTRWVGHLKSALQSFSSSFAAIEAHMAQLTETTERVASTSASKARGFLKLLRSADVVYYLHHLMDVITPLSYLSLQLQDRQSLVSEMHDSLNATVKAIKKLLTVDGMHLRKIVGQTSFCGVTLTHISTSQFAAARPAVTAAILECLERRFVEFSDMALGIIHATRIGSIQSWPVNEDALDLYGDDEVQTLTDHYRKTLIAAGADVDCLQAEWTMLKSIVFSTKATSWEDVFRQQERRLPNILLLIELLLTMSPSSAEAERGFSQLKLVKTNTRNRILQKNLNSCLAVRLLSKDISDYVPGPAVQHWTQQATCRRPDFSVKPVVKDDSDSDSGTDDEEMVMMKLLSIE